MNDEYMKGYAEGFSAGIKKMIAEITPGQFITAQETLPKPKRKQRQTPKQKLLTKMSKKKWDKYKKGSGKKTYVTIRAEVARSQAFKRAAKRL